MPENDELLQNLSPRPSLRDIGLEALRTASEHFPDTYIKLARRRNPDRLLVDESVDLLIEGFPRSGNTYFLSYVTVTNPGLGVASHLHSRAHIHGALKRGIPAVVLIRDPQAAVASELINRFGRNIQDQPARLLQRYHRFYRYCLAKSEQLSISTFETTTQHPELVVKVLNDQFDLKLNSEPVDQQDEVLADVERLNALHVGHPNELTVARPSRARTELAERIKQYLAEHHASTLTQLRELHDTLAASPTAVCREDTSSSDSDTFDT